MHSRLDAATRHVLADDVRARIVDGTATVIDLVHVGDAEGIALSD